MKSNVPRYTKFVLAVFLAVLVSCNNNKNSEKSASDTAASITDTSIVEMDTATLVTTSINLDTIIVGGAEFYQKAVNSDLMLFMFEKHGTRAKFNCSAISGTAIRILSSSTAGSRAVTGPSFRLRAGILAVNEVSDFIQDLKSKDGFDLVANPSAYSVIITGQFATNNGQSYVEGLVYVRRDSDAKMSTARVAPNPCPPCR